MGQKKGRFFCVAKWASFSLVLMSFGVGCRAGAQTPPVSAGTPYILHQSYPQNAEEGRPEQLFFDELVRSLFKNAKLPFIEQLQQPWKRAYQETLYGPRHVVYPTTRTADRENELEWAGPISRTVWNLYGMKHAGWAGRQLADIFASARIGVAMGSAREDYLRSRGAKNIVAVQRDDQLLAMLLADRIDVLAMGASSLGFLTSDAEARAVGRLASYRVCYLYVALSKDSPPGDVAKLQASLDRFYLDGHFLAMRRDFKLNADPHSDFIQSLLHPASHNIGCVDMN
ncbi:substrate-binding periplasmic protein [Thalassospira mesophila]|uniref:substrate-binding periplasmic protein n=1 Tax=Thalassospira mesophila TaxID=1293891 RepID=UPI000A1E1255|nr:transporter substrate-binding domain-containing protein [Thalassospira mesophila]